MNLRDFVARAAHYADEIGGDGATFTESHEGAPTLTIQVGDEFYDVADIELDRRMGCRCADGITIVAKVGK